jgi:hypothetical protein
MRGRILLLAPAALVIYFLLYPGHFAVLMSQARMFLD